MKRVNKFLMLLMALPLVFFMSCNNSVSEQLKKEMQILKQQCPQDQGYGVVMTDVNFYENEKVLEYVCSLEGVDELDDDTIANMKEAIKSDFKNGSDISAFEKLSVKTVLKTYSYKFRYIYTDTEGNILCTIEITKDDI